MLPLSSLESPIPQTAPSQTAGALTLEGGENRNQKPKTLPCKYCTKRFRRVEHVQRHERTHTKEKPFSCGWDRCGKTFGRRDLLVRHEKLVHLNDGNTKDTPRSRRPSSSSNQKPVLTDGLVAVDVAPMHGGILPPQAPPQQPQLQQTYQQAPMTMHNGGPVGHDPRMASRLAACNLDVLSDAALASEVSSLQTLANGLPQQPTSHARAKSFGESVTSASYSDRSREDQLAAAGRFAPPIIQQQHQHQPTGYDDYNIFLDDFASSPHFLPPNFEPNNLNSRMLVKQSSQLPSRIGSLAPDMRDTEQNNRSQEETRPSPLRISVQDHASIKAKVDEFTSILPSDFVFPSRHTLIRFLEGYISGFHDQLPFLHLPTLSLAELAPELVLAILAVGAQYRFESNRGYALWYAAKAVATEQIRRRHSSEVRALLPNATSYSPHSTRPSPSASYRHSFTSGQSERPNFQDGNRDSFINTAQARLETIQAVLLLFAIGLWGVKAILHESLSLQSSLAILIREEGLHMETNQASILDWESWIRREGAIRTKLIAYCFFNLCSTAYDMPPALLTSEVHLSLPLPSRLWRAETAWQWQELRQTTSMVEITLHEAFSRLFGRTGEALPPQLSALGNYILIHALIQHVYLLKQTSLPTGLTYDARKSLKPDDVADVTQALQTWQNSFQQRVRLRANEISNFGGTDTITGGSLVYNATALSRLAYIRLYTDSPPSRALETRDAAFIASALTNTPILSRGLRLNTAIFQVVHALSSLVKAGVNYVARTKSTEWSIQHSLCNFECAILLAKWLTTLAAAPASEVSMDERKLLEDVRRMLDETEFAVPMDSTYGSSTSDFGNDDSIKLRQMASAVVRLWAETFKGTHIFDMFKVMGSSLDGYADLMMKPMEGISAGRNASDVSM